MKFNFKEKQNQNQTPKFFIDYEQFQEMIEEKVQEKIINNASWHHELERIKKEGWLGETWERGKSGLLGYFRTNFGIQIKILNKIDNYVPIYQNEFVDFFRSKWFKDQTLINGVVSEHLRKNEHFEILKNNINLK